MVQCSYPSQDSCSCFFVFCFFSLLLERVVVMVMVGFILACLLLWLCVFLVVVGGGGGGGDERRSVLTTVFCYWIKNWSHIFFFLLLLLFLYCTIPFSVLFPWEILVTLPGKKWQWKSCTTRHINSVIVTIGSTLSSLTLQVPRAIVLSCFRIFNKHMPVTHRTKDFHCMSRTRHWVQRTSTLRLWRNKVNVLLVKLGFRPTAFWFHFTCLITWIFHIHSHDSTDTHSCYILQVITACIWTKWESNTLKNIFKWTNFAGSYFFLLLYVDCKVWIVFVCA